MEGRTERVDEGNKLGRDGTRHGRRDGRRGGRKHVDEGLSEEGREHGKEGNFRGGSIFTNQPFTNRPLSFGITNEK